MSTQENRNKLRSMTRGAYDLQRLRIQAGLRLCANFRNQLGQVAGEKEETIDEEAQDILKELRETYNRLTDGIISKTKKAIADQYEPGTKVTEETLDIAPKKSVSKRQFKGEGLISDYAQYVLVENYLELERVERKQFSKLKNLLEEFPIYTEFLEKTPGCGPAMSAVIISEIDIRKSKYPSSLFLYAGVDVVPEDGKGRSRQKQHLVKRTYTDKDGNEAERNSITFNPFLKSKLLGVLSGSFLRAKSPYAKVYNDYKLRCQHHETRKEWTKLHIHRASLRYMIKMFLIDLHVKWRELEGLEVSVPYHQAKLGLVHNSPSDLPGVIRNGELPGASQQQ